ncbi:MAG: kelch repeat-containing protein [Polyangiales bacterium]
MRNTLRTWVFVFGGAASLVAGLRLSASGPLSRTPGPDALHEPPRADASLPELRAFAPGLVGRVLRTGATVTEDAKGFHVGLARDGDVVHEALAVSDGGVPHAPVALELAPDGQARLSFGSATLELREEGVVGRGERVGDAVRLRVPHGYAYWSVDERGVEEWLAIEAGIADDRAPIARYRIPDGTLRADGEGIVVARADGRDVTRVTAPEAYTTSGRRVEARLAIEDDAIALYVDADREAVLVDPIWVEVAPLVNGTMEDVAALLPNGRVLAVEPHTPRNSLVYDPVADRWSQPTTTTSYHVGHSVTVLTTGRVLVVGGLENGAPHRHTDLYDPATDSWSAAADMVNARYYHAAARLADGRVLVAGGFDNQASLSLASAEIYDPTSDTWTRVADMPWSLMYAVAVTLDDGRVLVTGGLEYGHGNHDTSLLFDPATGSWSSTGAMVTPRDMHAAAKLPDGRVLVAAGRGTQYLASAEIYDPATNSWSPTGSMHQARVSMAYGVQPTGAVLLAGGSNATGGALDSVERYDPDTGHWELLPPLHYARYYATLATLADGSVLVFGGLAGTTYPKAVERYSTMPNGSACASRHDCRSGFCSDGVCCDVDCGSSVLDCRACSLASGSSQDGVCRPLPNGLGCEDGLSCSSASACSAGQCVATSPLDCDDGNACTADSCNESTLCTHTPLTSPGCTPDAGAVDAGVADAGGIDAGVADAGAVDAGPGDAGGIDAGVADAGRIDAGSADAAVPDASATDASVDGGEIRLVKFDWRCSVSAGSGGGSPPYAAFALAVATLVVRRRSREKRRPS